MKLFSLVLGCYLLLTNIPLIAQNNLPNPNIHNSHSLYIQLLKSSENALYENVLKRYDEYIRLHPNDSEVFIEKCKFIENAFYDEYEGYNPKQDEFDACLQKLYDLFPDDPDVLIYRSGFLYGDSAIAFMEDILAEKEKHPAEWKEKAVWQVYANLANQYEYEENQSQVIYYANQAMLHNDTLDLSLQLARQYKVLSNFEEAKNILITHLDSLGPSWQLVQKGELLLELGASEAALRALRYAEKDTLGWVNAVSIAKALEQEGEYEKAREYFVKKVEESWEKVQPLEQLFLHDLQYQHKDTAKATYEKLRDQGLTADLFSRNRIALFFKYPVLTWKWRDLLGLLILLATFSLLVLIPYLWVLPVQFTGFLFHTQKQENPSMQLKEFRWGLRHFWFISAAYLWVAFAEALIFDYEVLQSYFLDDYFTTTQEDIISRSLANQSLFFFTLLAIATTFHLKKSDVSIFWGSVWLKRKVLLIGFLSALGLRMLLALLAGIFSDTTPEFVDAVFIDASFFSIKTAIISIKEYYGVLLAFFFVVILVPIYEEIIFRGIILSACEKHIKFIGANLIQAVIFALLHEEYTYFPFYLSFGLVAGYLQKRSLGLASGITLHATNNLIAFFAMIR